MLFCHQYKSPLGVLAATADESGLLSLRFSDRCKDHVPSGSCVEGDFTMFDALDFWLDVYFSGKEPGVLPACHVEGTPFQKRVWALLAQIPYGTTVTYGELAVSLGMKRGAQAVGGAVGRNPLWLLIPCHRVLGAGGKLTGYAGGLERKKALLQLEGITSFRY